jgi:hypothetical protein
MLAFVLMAICTAATVLSVVDPPEPVTPPRRTGAAPPVTVLKPLCAADDTVAANLSTFFRQDYPAYEIVFGVADAADPAVAVARPLMAAHPGVSVRVVVHDGRQGLNRRSPICAACSPPAARTSKRSAALRAWPASSRRTTSLAACSPRPATRSGSPTKWSAT